jgi:uncharacterized protein (TIGR02646 family)
MIRVQFRDPNFRAKVREKSRVGAQPYFRLVYADDVAGARKKLESFGFEVITLRPYDFSKWQGRAKTARTAALNDYLKAHAAGKTFEFSSGLWGELKEHLQELFHGRCAYCEALFESVAFGDVEHYRPKAEVTGEPKHPGYYWLAYEPSNYLPSCQRCNQEAKRNYFPIAGTRASTPQDNLGLEDPLLFNPYQHDYFEYISYVPSRGKNGIEPTAGKAIGKSAKGKKSIEVYNLDRERLVRDRRRVQESIRAILKVALSNEDQQRLNDLLIGCLSGTEEFSTAVATEIDHYYKTMGLGSPFPSHIKLGA